MIFVSDARKLFLKVFTALQKTSTKYIRKDFRKFYYIFSKTYIKCFFKAFEILKNFSRKVF